MLPNAPICTYTYAYTQRYMHIYGYMQVYAFCIYAYAYIQNAYNVVGMHGIYICRIITFLTNY